MQFYMIIGQGVPEIQGVTHRQTQDEDLLYRSRRKKSLMNFEFFPPKSALFYHPKIK